MILVEPIEHVVAEPQGLQTRESAGSRLRGRSVQDRLQKQAMSMHVVLDR